MTFEIREEPGAALEEVARIPMSFEVRSVLDVVSVEDEFRLSERPVAAPYVKDYDAIPGEGPASWARRFDVLRWGLLGAHLGSERVGAAVVAFDTPGLDLLHGRRDVALLWDLRVSPHARRRGIGAALVAAAEAWARGRGCRALEVETQNVNTPACRLYTRRGFTLRSVDRNAYPDLPGEIQFLWRKTLTEGPARI